ncbi:MAG: flippase-like domain-containing protein [Ignavibacteriaceae bacterium]|nr:flippase-like domain-containing protein [Ignavibacteriaceae bacterium]
MTSDKKHHLRRAINYSFSFLLSIIFLYIAFKNANIEEVVHYVSNASWLWIWVFGIVLLFSHYLRALRWQIMLHSVKPDTSIKNIFGALMVGYGVNNVVPRAGEVSRAVLLGKWEGLSRSSMFGTVIVERVIDVIFLLLSVLVSVLIWSGNLYESFPWLKSALIISFIGVALFVAFLILVIKQKEKFYGGIIKLLGRFSISLAHKSAHIFEMLAEGFTSLKGTRNYFLVILLSVIMMLVYAGNAYIGFLTIGMQNVAPVSYKMAWVLMSISAIGVAIPTPGGTGSYHTLAKSTLVLLFGFGENISLAFAFISHIISYTLCIVVALIVFFVLNRQHESLKKVLDTEVDEL